MINVTKTFLPPIEEYTAILKEAWNASWLTNRGVLVKRLEEDLKVLLGVRHVLALSNGTLPLHLAIRALDVQGEVITTPFTYIATTSSIIWERCKPVFVDIDAATLTIDAEKIEAAITPETGAILATHVYGNPCDVKKIQEIANRRNLKVIYDAAHCFNVAYEGQSIFSYGDISTCSFHATKLFHTGEGGALFCNASKMEDRCFSLHNFGHEGQEAFSELGTNAKMSELQAAVGLSVLPYMDTVIEDRKIIVESYRESLRNLPLRFLEIRAGTTWNYSYFPVIFESESSLLLVKEKLESASIYPRRYFYPSLNTLDFTSGEVCEISENIARSVLCLPLYSGLTPEELNEIVRVIQGVFV